MVSGGRALGSLRDGSLVWEARGALSRSGGHVLSVKRRMPDRPFSWPNPQQASALTLRGVLVVLTMVGVKWASSGLKWEGGGTSKVVCGKRGLHWCGVE